MSRRQRFDGHIPRSLVALFVGLLGLGGWAVSPFDPAAANAEAGQQSAAPAPAASGPIVGPVGEWIRRGRPTRLVVIKPDTLVVVRNGRPDAPVALRPGPVTLSRLTTALPEGWVTHPGQATRLNAAVTVIGGNLDLSDLKVLELAAPQGQDGPASVHTGGGGRTSVRGTSVVAVDPVTGRPAAVDVIHPGFTVSGGGRLDVTDAVLRDLGAAPEGGMAGRPALDFRNGGTGSVVRTTLQGNGHGMFLMRSQNVHLDSVTVRGSAGDGVILRGDRGTVIRGLTSEGNEGNGVLDTDDTSGRSLGSLHLTGNRDYGLAVVAAIRPTIRGLTSSANGKGALRLSRVSGGTVTDIASSDEPAGVFLNFNTDTTTVRELRTARVRRAAAADTTTHRLAFHDIVVREAQAVGISVGGDDTCLQNIDIATSTAAVRIEHGANRVAVQGLSVADGLDGVVAASGSTGVVINGLVTRDLRADDVRSESAGMVMQDSTLRGGHTGVELGATGTLRRLQILGAAEAVRVRGLGEVRIESLDARTKDRGVTAELGTTVTLASSHIEAPLAIQGSVTLEGNNALSLPPIGIIAMIGGPLVLLAVTLEVIHAGVSHRRRRSPSGPDSGSDSGSDGGALTSAACRGGQDTTTPLRKSGPDALRDGQGSTAGARA